MRLRELTDVAIAVRVVPTMVRGGVRTLRHAGTGYANPLRALRAMLRVP